MIFVYNPLFFDWRGYGVPNTASSSFISSSFGNIVGRLTSPSSSTTSVSSLFVSASFFLDFISFLGLLVLIVKLLSYNKHISCKGQTE